MGYLKKLVHLNKQHAKNILPRNRLSNIGNLNRRDVKCYEGPTFILTLVAILGSHIRFVFLTICKEEAPLDDISRKTARLVLSENLHSPPDKGLFG